VPLSEVMREGTPNLDTQPLIKASAQEAADISLCGQELSHLVGPAGLWFVQTSPNYL
jgi:hypothetical protein